MTRPIALLKWCSGLAFLMAACALIAPPASADSVYFGFNSGHYHPGYYHHPYYGPRYYGGPRVVFVEPPPVVYSAPPPPVVYAQPDLNTPLNAVPASAPYQTSDGRYCREYQAQVMVNGAPQASYGTACQQPDGSWRVMN